MIDIYWFMLINNITTIFLSNTVFKVVISMTNKKKKRAFTRTTAMQQCRDTPHAQRANVRGSRALLHCVVSRVRIAYPLTACQSRGHSTLIDTLRVVSCGHIERLLVTGAH